MKKFIKRYAKQIYQSEFVTKTILMTKRVLVVMAVICLMAWSAVGAANYFPKQVYADRVQTVVVEASTTPPVLQKIMQCESTASQKDKSGQVTIHVNKDGSYDMGIMQINSIWNSTATKMGYDLTKESDNKAFGTWLFMNKGSDPWNSSKNCWGK